MTPLARSLPILFCCVAGVAWAQSPPVSSQPSSEELQRTPVPDPIATPPVIGDAPPAEPERGPRVTVDFRIEGVEEPELSNAYNWLGYVAEDQRGRLDEDRLRALHAGAEKSIVKALQPYGYYDTKVRSELRGGPVDFFALYRVELGTPVRWTEPHISVTGEGAEERVTVESLAPRTGRRLRHAEYDAFKTRALNLLREAGYLDVRITDAQLRVDTAEHRATAVLGFDTGAHWRFGALRFKGSDKVRESLLRRYVRFNEGDSFSPQKMLDTQFAINDLDYFGSVEINPLREEAQDGAIPVEIVLTDGKKRRDDYGVGYGTDTGARVSAATEFKRLNQDGHKLRLAARASQKISGATGEYRIPVGGNPGEFLSFSGAAEQDNLSYGTSRDFRLGAALNRSAGDWKRVYYLRFHRSLFDFTEGVDDNSTLLTPGITLSRQWLDDPAYARRGLAVYLDTHGAQEGVLSDTSFFQARTILKGALPLDRRLTRLLARVEFGATAARAFEKLPPDERFFAGGDQSVRGYSYQSIGAGRDDNGGVIGGRFLNVFSVEVERSIRGPWGAAIFTDAGGVGDAPNPRLEYGVGIGARYRAPFGSVQVDVAHPLKRDESPVRLHIGVRVGL